MAKVRKLKVWKVEKFDWEVTLFIYGSDFDSKNWNRIRIHTIDVVRYDFCPRVGPLYVVELVGIFGQCPGGPGCARRSENQWAENGVFNGFISFSSFGPREFGLW